jgi:hypothetical protein
VTVKLSTTLNNLERSLSSEENKKIMQIRLFDKYDILRIKKNPEEFHELNI